MLHKLKNRQEEKSGFTIIEVMIVLAIAGLIILIVLLAVPALQRSARNTQRREDASAMAGAISNFVNDNNGQLPKDVSDNNSTNTVEFSIGQAGNVEVAKLGYFTTAGNLPLGSAAVSDGEIFTVAAASPAAAWPTAGAAGSALSATNVTQNGAVIIWGEDCTPTTNPRTAAIFFVVETGGAGNGAVQCIEQ